MPAPNVNDTPVVSEELQLLRKREREDEARLEWLRAAAKQGFDAIDRGDYVTLRLDKEIEAFVDELQRSFRNSPPKQRMG